MYTKGRVACNEGRGHLRYWRRGNEEFFMADVQPELIALGFIWYVAFLFSTTCHEAAHALAAKIGGGETAFAGGAGSPNPRRHTHREPWGTGGFPCLPLASTANLF